jgi:hypothetical protein
VCARACVRVCVCVSDAERRYVGTYVPWGYRLADRPRTVATRFFAKSVKITRFCTVTYRRDQNRSGAALRGRFRVLRQKSRQTLSASLVCVCVCVRVCSHTHAHTPSQLREAEGVVFHGQLSDAQLEFVYASTRVALAPLLSGAGVKGKVGACVCACVSGPYRGSGWPSGKSDGGWRRRPFFAFFLFPRPFFSFFH